MKDRKLATRYARALLASQTDPTKAELADDFLTALGAVMRESSEFRDLLLDPALPRATRRQVLTSLAEQASMPSEMVNFLATVVDHNRTTSLPSIAAVYHEEREKSRGIVSAQITTALPMSDDLKQRTLRALQQMTGRQVRLATQIEPGIIGGAVTRVGSTVYDGSLRTQLDRLRRKMMQE